MKYLLQLCVFLFSLNTAFSAPSIEKEEEHAVVILGSGVGALTSATYLGRAGAKPLVITGSTVGGAITQSHCVQNWPGEIEISGFDLSEKMRKQAEFNGAAFRSEEVVSVDFSKKPFVITTKEVFGDEEKLKKIKAQVCIVALGASPNLLNIPGESGDNGYWSNGVYSCAVCDGSLYKDKIVAVAGGGDSALTEAHYLASIAKKVYIIVRKDRFRALEEKRAKEILSLPNVEVLYHHEVQEVCGNGEMVTHLKLLNNQTQDVRDLPADALFLAIGATPNTSLFQGQLELDSAGYIVLKKNQETSVEGVYALGDISDPEFKQAVSAAGDAAKASLQAQKHLAAFQSNQTLASKEKPIAQASVLEVRSKEQLVKELRQSDGPVFIDFYSTYCGPCKAFSPQYETWAKDFQGKIKFLKVNSAHARELFEEFQIRGVPTLVILDSKGVVIRKSVGTQEIAQVNQRLNKVRSKETIDPLSFK